MTILEGLKQAEIKWDIHWFNCLNCRYILIEFRFKRIFKNVAMDSDLINLWWSPTLRCIVVDRVSSIENNKAMKWRITVINSNGEVLKLLEVKWKTWNFLFFTLSIKLKVEFEDFCLPANGQVFLKPGSSVQLVYTPVRDVKNINWLTFWIINELIVIFCVDIIWINITNRVILSMNPLIW